MTRLLLAIAAAIATTSCVPSAPIPDVTTFNHGPLDDGILMGEPMAETVEAIAAEQNKIAEAATND